MIVADHGNAEELLDENGRPKTSHTINRVPCIICDDTKNHFHYRLSKIENPSLQNVAATIATLCGQSDLPQSWAPSLIEIND